jgi:RNA polymerase sigma-70 factor (ECF subfamily)
VGSRASIDAPRTSYEVEGGEGVGDHRIIEDWFAETLSPLVPEAYQVATYWLGSAQAAEDLVQEALVRAWTHREQLHRSANPRAWLLTVIRRLCLDDFRQRRRRPSPLPFQDALTIAAPGDAFQDLEDRLLVGTLIANLQVRDQELLAWRYGLDLPYEAIAERTGMSTNTVKSRIHRALDTLRRRFQDETPSPQPAVSPKVPPS